MINESDSDKDELEKAVFHIFVLCVINVKLVFVYLVLNYFTLVLTNFFSQWCLIKVIGTSIIPNYFLFAFFLFLIT